MKPITLHPASVLAGLVLAGALVVVSGAAQSHGTVQSIPSHDVRLIGEIPAGWWTHILLTASQPFTVPADRTLVVTLADYPSIIANGQPESLLPVTVYPYNADHDRNGTRVVFQPGAVISLPSPTISPFSLWGYLEPL